MVYTYVLAAPSQLYDVIRYLSVCCVCIVQHLICQKNIGVFWLTWLKPEAQELLGAFYCLKTRINDPISISVTNEGILN